MLLDTLTKEVWEVIEYDRYKDVVTLRQVPSNRLFSIREAELRLKLTSGKFVKV